MCVTARTEMASGTKRKDEEAIVHDEKASENWGKT